MFSTAYKSTRGQSGEVVGEVGDNEEDDDMGERTADWVEEERDPGHDEARRPRLVPGTAMATSATGSLLDRGGLQMDQG